MWNFYVKVLMCMKCMCVQLRSTVAQDKFPLAHKRQVKSISFHLVRLKKKRKKSRSTIMRQTTDCVAILSSSSTHCKIDAVEHMQISPVNNSIMLGSKTMFLCQHLANSAA